MNYATLSIQQFLTDVASANVTPAGGTASAVAGALGASLCEMVCVHTLRAAEEETGTGELATIREDLLTQRQQLLELATADAEAVEDFYHAPDSAPVETEAKRAAGVPLAIAEACLTIIDDATVVTANATLNAVPDVVTGAYLTHAALQASVFTVRCNLDHIEDSSFIEAMDQQAAEIEQSAERAFEQVLSNGESALT